MKSILIIEDNEQNLYLARFMLEKQGYRVEAAPDGPSGIVAALQQRPSLILLDIQLPGMDGHEVARRLRTHAELDATPIVAVTSYAMAGDRERILAAGCTGYIEKPINPATFVDEIRGILDRFTAGRKEFHVLVADDLEPNRELLQAIFTAHGWKVTCASNGAEALGLARREPPDLMVTDILMPRMDGFALCREWRRDRRLAGVPFVFYTATYTDPQDERFGLSLGADAFLIKPLEPAPLMQRLQAVLASHREATAPVVPTAPDEQATLREYNAALVRKLEDKMQQFETLNRELEQRVQQRTRELEAANLQLQVFGHLGTWVLEAGPAGRLIWSAETCRLFGVTAESFDGQLETFLRQVPTDDVETVRDALRAAWSGLCPLNVQHRIVRPDGQLRWIRQEAALENDAAGHPVRLVGIVRDTTEQRRLEDQLRQSQKMEAVGQLAGGVAHDFNNLLTVIRGHSALLQGLPGLPEGAADSLQEIAGAAERASRLTRQLLTFSRRQPLELRPLDLNQVVADMARMLRSLVGEQIAFREELAANLPGVLADSAMLEQVVMNLVVNARDAMPRGGELLLRTSLVELDGEAAARVGITLAGGRFVCLTVQDTGCGIDAKHLPHIFEPFFTTKSTGKGTGLGLAMVYGIIQQHDGHITVASDAGTGTTFTVFLPASDAAPVTASPSAEVRVRPAGSETVLVVEDEPSVRGLVLNVLRRNGYQVFEAEDPDHALALWARSRGAIDLLLTDVVMPGPLSGRELADRLQREQPRLKVILSSGYSPEAIDSHTAPPGNVAFLQKPYHPEVLLKLVRECLDA